MTLLACSEAPTSNSGGGNPAGAAAHGGSTSGGSANGGSSVVSGGGSNVSGGAGATGTLGGAGGTSGAGTSGGGTGGISGGTAEGGAGGSSGSAAGAAGSAPNNPPPPLTGTTVTATISTMRGATMGKLTAGAAGFSFEKSHLSDAFFTGTHAPLIAMLKLLGPGVVRIGADDVNNSVWVPSATFVKPGTTSPNVGTAEVDALADFLTATGWKAIYAVNMRGSSTPQTAVTELDYVVPKLGSNLVAVEIGNELNLYPISNAEAVWHSFAQAIRAKFPSTKIAGPGDFEDINYATNFIKGEASLIDIVTHHYYRGQAGTGTATLANLVNIDPVVTSGSQSLASSVQSNHIAGGYRYGETNTYSSHGAAGISDALVSALWGVNFLLSTAQLGSVGTNFHGGGQNMDGNTCPNGVASCDRPFRYSPLVEVDSRVTAAAPLFYGLLLVSRIGAGNMLTTKVTTTGGTKLRAYAVTPEDGSTSIVLVNSEASTGVDATVDIGSPVTTASAIYLRGSSLTATTGVTLGEAPVTPAGDWSPKSPYTLNHTGNTLTVPVPFASAVLITVH
ncbi:MAG: glycosyl hydrolase family 79 C-terminal domain-containing protein [Myxococcales bacterium]